jgi:hypothetical protein
MSWKPGASLLLLLAPPFCVDEEAPAAVAADPAAELAVSPMLDDVASAMPSIGCAPLLVMF